jgi:hypothetical protein
MGEEARGERREAEAYRRLRYRMAQLRSFGMGSVSLRERRNK